MTLTFTDYHSQVSLNGLKKRASSQGLTITKITDTGNVILSTVSNGKTSVKLEVNHARKVEGTITTYVLADGTEIEILSLTPDQFIEEKIDAYSDRSYIRDTYDIYKPLTKKATELAMRMNCGMFN
jgi:predicted nucleotidyltransferase component of viral defense system